MVAKRATLPTIPSLERLASRLSVGGDGEFVYYDRAPQSSMVQPAAYAIWLASISSPFGWMLFWGKYLNHGQSRAHVLAWAHNEIVRSGAKPEHIKELTDMLGKRYFEGREVSARRIEKKLRVCKKFTAPRYVETISKILDAAFASEATLGKQVSKMTSSR